MAERDKDLLHLSSNMTEKDQLVITQVPVVDLSDPDQDLVARKVVKACQEWGAFQVVNHGISTELITRFQNVGRQFFELTETEKEAVAKPARIHPEGYWRRFQLDLESGQGTVEQLIHYVWPPSCVNYRYWPTDPLDYRKVNEEYASEAKKLLEKIMGWLSEGLGLRCDAIKEVTGGKYMINNNYYPPCPHLDLVDGLDPHTDVNGLTLLLTNEIPGLQVFKDDNWINLAYIPSALIVLIGDQIQILSNGKYKNVLHKTTVDKEKTRMSWPFMAMPAHDMVIQPFPELTSNEDPPKFEPIGYKDYVHRKFASFGIHDHN